MDILTYMKQNTLILDGAMGTMLQKSGMAAGEIPELLSITNPELICSIHEAYLNSGSNVIYTNTFGASPHKLIGCSYSTEEVISASVGCAKTAAANAGHGYIALDIGPLGCLLEPMGTMTLDEAYELFARQVKAGEENGADLIVIETMTDLYEMKAALLAAKENSTLPVFCTMSFDEKGRTFTGCPVSAMAITLEGLGADAIGFNCSLGPAKLMPMVKELIELTHLPVIVKPNAGLPHVSSEGKTCFDLTPKQFAAEMSELYELGVSIMGGCCGSSPDYIKELKTIIPNTVKAITLPEYSPAVCSGTKYLPIDRTRIVGERINPTGKKAMQAALRSKDMGYILKQAAEQTKAGAELLDINCGAPDTDEASSMIMVVKGVQSISDAPLMLDSSDVGALEAGLRIYNGIPIVNSVNGKASVLESVLPLVKKYGAMTVGLTMDENGIPKSAVERFKIAEHIVNTAAKYGIPRSKIVIDCLTLTAGAQQEDALQTIIALRMVKEKLNVKTTLGVSNISFGLPRRDILNRTFLAMALSCGLDLPIMNPNIPDMTDTVFAWRLLCSSDKGGLEYINRLGKSTVSALPQAVNTMDIGTSIAQGLCSEAGETCRQLLSSVPPLTIVNDYLIPALDKVGKDYEAGKIFLPQLIRGAEAASYAFEEIRAFMQKKGQTALSRGTIVIATVQGDIHDIGKNIVKTVLENYGYTLIDLGRDVPPSRIVESVLQNNASLLGLSALMTTTLPAMAQTIKEIREAAPFCKVMVGGAVLTQEAAKNMDADFYACDATAAVGIAKTVFD
jgi:5-methyltetrahydrofolate--homocysteine methyltransferase